MTDSRDYIAAARAVAAELGHAYVGSEHLLLAWFAQAEGAIRDAMVAAGLTPESFRELVASSRGRPVSAPDGGDGLTSRAAKVLALANERARAAGRDAPSDDDLILALLHEPHGAIARALGTRKLKPSDLKALARGGKGPRRSQPEGGGQKGPRERQADRPPAAPARARGESGRRRDPEIDDIPEARPPARPRLTPAPPPPPPEAPKRRGRPSLWSFLYLAIPLSLLAEWRGSAPELVFALASLAILPLAALMGVATERLAERSGPALGGLLNATFGNAAELIIAIAALRAGLVDLVKASITGSILGNLLLVLGVALVAGGLRRPLLTFNRTAAGMATAMLALAAAALVLPAVVHAAHPANSGIDLHLSEVVAVVLAATYGFSLLFVLRTHRPLFGRGEVGTTDGGRSAGLMAIALLAVATAGIAVESELLVGVIEPVSRNLGVSEAFLGLFLIPIIGNAAEHSTAVLAAWKGEADLALQIAVGSSTQVALFVAPLLVLVAPWLSPVPLTLLFTPLEVAGVAVAVVVSGFITLDGESHWFEGVQLLALYGILATAAWFI